MHMQMAGPKSCSHGRVLSSNLILIRLTCIIWRSQLFYDKLKLYVTGMWILSSSRDAFYECRTLLSQLTICQDIYYEDHFASDCNIQVVLVDSHFHCIMIIAVLCYNCL